MSVVGATDDRDLAALLRRSLHEPGDIGASIAPCVEDLVLTDGTFADDGPVEIDRQAREARRHPNGRNEERFPVPELLQDEVDVAPEQVVIGVGVFGDDHLNPQSVANLVALNPGLPSKNVMNKSRT